MHCIVWPHIGFPHSGRAHCGCRRKGPDGERVRGGILGLGLLMGGAVFSYGRTCGCHKAEILAIRDDGAPTLAAASLHAAALLRSCASRPETPFLFG